MIKKTSCSNVRGFLFKDDFDSFSFIDSCMKKLLLLIFSFLLLGGSLVNAQTLNDKLNSAYSKFSVDEQLKYATTSLTVRNAETGKVIYSVNGEAGLAPASTLKTITAATALAVLGEDYQFETKISYSGNIANGILSGDLIINGSGDPSLGSDRFKSTTKDIILNKILAAIKSAGITKINGRVIADDAIWESQSLPQGWIWQDIGNYYGAQTSAICWGENEFELNFTPSKSVGESVSIRQLNSVYPFIDIKNELKTGVAGSGDKVYGYSAPYNPTIYLRGTYGMDLKKAIRFSLPDPAFAMAYDVSKTLDASGISVLGYTTSRVLDNKFSAFNAKILLSLNSPHLKDIIYHFNRKSINLYGEQLVRVLSKKKGASITDGLDFIKKYWAAKGIDSRSLNILDGSGLSPANRITSQSMSAILYQCKSQKWFNSFYASLPLYNNMKMKSGTIGGVIAYTGYHNNMCFSIMVNNYNGSTSQLRQKVFALLNHLK